MQLLDEASASSAPTTSSDLFGADNAWDVVEEVLIRYFNERLQTSPRQRMAVTGREVLRWLAGTHVLQTGRGAVRGAAARDRRTAEEWLTSAQAMGLAKRSGTDRVMPWEQMGQAGVAARYSERSPAQMPPAARAGGPIYPRRNGLGTYRGGQGGVPVRPRR